MINNRNRRQLVRDASRLSTRKDIKFDGEQARKLKQMHGPFLLASQDTLPSSTLNKKLRKSTSFVKVPEYGAHRNTEKEAALDNQARARPGSAYQRAENLGGTKPRPRTARPGRPPPKDIFAAEGRFQLNSSSNKVPMP